LIVPVSLRNFSDEIAALVETASASVVAVHGRPRVHSSGVQWQPGLIVTAEHALRRDEDIVVTRGEQKFSAELVGRDPGTDLALLRLKDGDVGAGPEFADSGAVRPGSLAIAVGRNHESANAALGVIASIGGPSQSRRGGKLDQVVRLDLPLHPAAAGGAVVDASGKLIGIATPALSRFSVFAVPHATVDRVVQALLAHGRVPQGYLGAGLQPIALPEHLIEKLGLKSPVGLMAVSVDQDAPAGKAGMLIGDVLLEWNGAPLRRPESLRPLLAEAVGKTARARILRGGEPLELAVTVAERTRSR
jgi:S1-C subfamily serine protease